MIKFKTIEVKILDPSTVWGKELVNFMERSYMNKENFLLFDKESGEYSMTYFDEYESYLDRLPELLCGKKKSKPTHTLR